MPDTVDIAAGTSTYARRMFAAAFLIDFSFGILLAAIPYLAIRLGGSVLDLGILGASRGAIYALACPFTGALSDVVGRKRMALGSCVAIACGNFFLARSTQLWHVFAGFMIIGLSLAFFWPLVLAWVGDIHSGTQLPRATAVFNVCWSSGIMMGALVGGALFSIVVFAPFICAAGAAFLAFGVLGALPDPAGKSLTTARNTYRVRRLFHPALVIAWISNFAVCFGLGVLQYVFPKQAHNFGLGAATFGWLLFAIGFGRTAVFLGTASSSFKVSPRHVTCSALVLAAISLLVSMQSRNTALLLMAFSMSGLAIGVTYYFSYLQSLVGTEGRGRKTGMHETALVGGIMAGSLVGGISARIIGPKFPYLIGIIVLIGAIISQFIFRTDDGRKERICL